MLLRCETNSSVLRTGLKQRRKEMHYILTTIRGQYEFINRGI